MNDEERLSHAERMNAFYCRFDIESNREERQDECVKMLIKSQNEEIPSIEIKTVDKIFSAINSRKAPGSDNISVKVLKLCFKELSGVFVLCLTNL